MQITTHCSFAASLFNQKSSTKMSFRHRQSNNEHTLAPRFGTLQPPKLYRFIHPKSTLQPPKFDTLHPQWEFFNSKKTFKK